MRPLTEFNPKWVGQLRSPEHGEGLAFDCPTCGPKHTLVAYFTNPIDGGPAMPAPPNQRWTRSGEDFAKLTVKPSLDYPCWHGWVEGGQVIHVSEGRPVQLFNPETKEHLGSVALSPGQVRELETTGKLR